MWLCGLYYGAFPVLKSFRALCPRVSPFLLASIPSFGEEGAILVCVLLVHLFVCLVRVSFCQFSFPLAVGDWLRFVTVTVTGLFY